MKQLVAGILVVLGSVTPVMAGKTLSTGVITWTSCAKNFPTDIRFETHKKAGRAELFHDKDSGSIDVSPSGKIGADNLAGKKGKKKTVKVTGTIYAGTVQRQDCTGTFVAK